MLGYLRTILRISPVNISNQTYEVFYQMKTLLFRIAYALPVVSFISFLGLPRCDICDFLTNKQIWWIYVLHRSGSCLFTVNFKFHKILFTGYVVMVYLWILNQIKGNKSCTTIDNLWALACHDNIKVLSFVKFHSLITLLWLNLFIFQQFKDNNSLHTGATLTKCKMHQWMDVWLAILRPFQQYFSHFRTMGGW